MQAQMLAAAAQQNINLIVLIFVAAHAHGDTTTMQLVVDNYAQAFSNAVQQAMRTLLSAAVAEQTLVQHLHTTLEPHAQASSSTHTSEDLMQAAISKAMLH